jgi:hypothetical protein
MEAPAKAISTKRSILQRSGNYRSSLSLRTTATGLSTPVNEQYRCQDLSARGAGYGMRSVKIDGNNVLEVYRTLRDLAAELREEA